MGARAGKYKFGARAGKHKLGARAGRYKLGGQGRGPSKGPGAGKYKYPSTDLFIIINTETSNTKIFVFHVITVGHYNRLSRINIRSFYNFSNLPVMADDRSLFRPL